ncbi:hypothetical protein ABZ725_52340 [Streptomyces sp. NPDC006872]|uniref:hypothetical protein n=1 Tax=Streptomyces sp. NPDC006872 TaxID=3155720 RepID=UPI0033DF9D19
MEVRQHRQVRTLDLETGESAPLPRPQQAVDIVQAVVGLAIGFAVALVFGFAMTHYCDRKGLHRMVAKEA